MTLDKLRNWLKEKGGLHYNLKLGSIPVNGRTGFHCYTSVYDEESDSDILSKTRSEGLQSLPGNIRPFIELIEEINPQLDEGFELAYEKWYDNLADMDLYQLKLFYHNNKEYQLKLFYYNKDINNIKKNDDFNLIVYLTGEISYNIPFWTCLNDSWDNFTIKDTNPNLEEIVAEVEYGTEQIKEFIY